MVASDKLVLEYEIAFEQPEAKELEVQVPVKLAPLTWNLLSDEQQKKVFTHAYVKCLEAGLPVEFTTAKFRIDRVLFDKKRD